MNELPGRLTPLLHFRPAVCKTGLAASSRKMKVHRVEWMKTRIVDGRLRCWAQWVCGGSSIDAVVIADPEPFGGVCQRCELMGWFVYRCLAEGVRLLYIGSTGDRYMRFKGHARSSPWWPEVADIQVAEYPDETSARIAEALAINTEHPLHNKQPCSKKVAA